MWYCSFEDDETQCNFENDYALSQFTWLRANKTSEKMIKSPGSAYHGHNYIYIISQPGIDPGSEAT